MRTGLPLRLSSLLLLLFVGYGMKAQTPIFNEQFNEGDGATMGVDVFGNGWTADCSGCAGTFEIQGGDLVQNQSRIVTLFSTDNISIDGCNTISFEMNYSGTEFSSSSGDFLDSATKCGCPGDVNDPYAAGCDNCWDFMLIELVFEDGSREEVELIGTTFLPTTAFIQHTSDCVGSNTEVSIEIRSQTWGSTEFMRIENLRLFCNDPIIDINITQDPSGTFCVGDQVELAVNNAAGETFEWFDPNDNPIGGSGNSINFSTSSSFGFGIQSFRVISTDASGCKSQAMRNIIVNDTPDAVLPSDFTVCEGDAISIQETGGDATTWSWSGPATGNPSTDTWLISNAILSNSGTYTVSVTDGSSCLGTEAVDVTVEPGGSFNLTPLGDICQTAPPINLGTNQDGVDGNWSGFGVTANVFDPTAVVSGNYNLTFTPNSAACLFEQQTPISVLSPPQSNPPISPLESCGATSAIFDLTSQDNIINGGSNFPVSWFEDAGLTVPINDPINFNSPSATVYAIVTENGCQSDIQQLDLLLTAGPQIMMPSSLSGCETITLTPIVIAGASGSEAYYSETNGGGSVIPVGTVFTNDTVVYAFDTSGSCVSEQEISLEVGKAITAGIDRTLMLCASDSVDLLDYVDPSAEAGNFVDGGGNPILNNRIFALDFAASTIQLLYVTAAGNGCPPDTAFYNIGVGLSNEAGPDTMARSCHGEEFDLRDLTFDQGLSGSFETLAGDSISNPLVVTGNDVDPFFEVNYIVNSNLSCDPDTALIVLQGENPPSRVIDGEVCSDFETSVNGNIYNASNPSGTEAFTSGDFCDSLVTVNLNFRPENRQLINPTLCTSQEIVVNNVVYNEANPSGMEVIIKGDQFGCDSIIEIDLSYDTEVVTLLDFDLCSNQDTLINGEIYTAGASVGSATFTSVSGCDSLVMVDLNILQVSETIFSGVFCPADSLLIEGEVFNIDRPTGTILSQIPNAVGCDSTIVVNMDFDQSRSERFDFDLCSDLTVNINGNIYGSGNSSGSEIVSVPNECDSLYIIDLNILQADTLLISETFCSDTSIVVNNVVYDSTRRQGEELIIGGASTGCNQYVFIDLEFIESVSEEISMDLCFGDSLVVNGVVYDEANPTGQEILQTSNGCDSLINIELNYQGVDVSFVEGSIDCTQGSDETTLAVIINDGEDLVEDIILDGISVIDRYRISNVLEGITTGDHELVIFSTDGCSITYPFNVAEVGLEEISVSSMVVDEEYYQLDLNFTGEIAQILWTPSEGLDCIDCPSLQARPPGNTTYTVQVIDENGCPYTFSVDLRFLASSVIYQANIFSPNEDGFNDIFFLDSQGVFEYSNFSIFDRWGNQVFKSTNGVTGDPGSGWDGIGYEEGVYVYFIELNFPDGSQTLSGEISLIR